MHQTPRALSLFLSLADQQIVDFTMPFMNLGISVLYRKPVKQPPNLFSFLSPLSLDVWIYMATAYLGVSVLLFILARYVCIVTVVAALNARENAVPSPHPDIPK